VSCVPNKIMAIIVVVIVILAIVIGVIVIHNHYSPSGNSSGKKTSSALASPGNVSIDVKKTTLDKATYEYYAAIGDYSLANLTEYLYNVTITYNGVGMLEVNPGIMDFGANTSVGYISAVAPNGCNTVGVAELPFISDSLGYANLTNGQSFSGQVPVVVADGVTVNELIFNGGYVKLSSSQSKIYNDFVNSSTSLIPAVSSYISFFHSFQEDYINGVNAYSGSGYDLVNVFPSTNSIGPIAGAYSGQMFTVNFTLHNYNVTNSVTLTSVSISPNILVAYNLPVTVGPQSKNHFSIAIEMPDYSYYGYLYVNFTASMTPVS